MIGNRSEELRLRHQKFAVIESLYSASAFALAER